MIDAVAEKIAVTLKRMNEHETASVEIMKFSLIALLNTASITVFALAIGYYTNRLTDTGLALLAFALLRMVSGGYHLQSSDICVLFSTSLFSIIPHIPLNAAAVWILTAGALFLVLAFAPSGIENQTRIPKKYYLLLKIISAVLVSINFLLLSPAVALALFVQAATLIVKGGEQK